MSRKGTKKLSREEIRETLRINSKTKLSDLEGFTPIVEMIARKESQYIPNNLMHYDELMNTGLIAVNKLIETARHTKGTEYNSSYIAQSVKWAIKDEIRVRQAWYGVKKSEAPAPEKIAINSIEDAKRAVFEVIMSVESMEEDLGFTPADESSPEFLEQMELLEMKESLRKSISKLPDNLRQVIEMRFYEGLSGNEVADKLNVTASRISHMINEAIKRLKIFMTAEGYR